jgi:hypothetical protein
MAQFVWDATMAWPPPADILLAYDVVDSGGAYLSSQRDRQGRETKEEKSMPQAYWIIPLEGGGGQIDNSLPGGRPPHIGGGPIYHPGHPDHGLPSSPGHPANRPPGSWGGPTDPGYGWGGGEHPGNRPPGSEYPGGGPAYGGGHPTGGPIVPPQGGTEVPESDYQPLPPPEDIYSQYVVSVWNPKTASWTTKSYPPS